MSNEKHELTTYIDQMDGVYVLWGSSPFNEPGSFEQKMYSNFSLLKKNLTLEFFIEYICPDHADMMFNITVKMKKNLDFYKNEKFVENLMAEIYNISFNAFMTSCENAKIAPPPVEPDESFAPSLASQVKKEIPSYINKWNAMRTLLEGTVFEIPESDGRGILLQVTAHILDMIFLNSPATDRMHNRSVLEKNTGMTFSEFLMMRKLCITDTRGRIGFSPLESIRLFQLLDCTAQVLTGKIYDKIVKEMEPGGWVDEYRKKYLHEVEVFNEMWRSKLNGFFEKPLPSLVPYYDWDKDLR